jgi:hypothetical protein
MTNSNTTIEARAVHVSQLVPEIMDNLSKQGFSISYDNRWLVFTREVDKSIIPGINQSTNGEKEPCLPEANVAKEGP